MFDWDVIIIGGGPAGLTAGMYLCRGKRSVLLLEKNNFGGPILDYECIENYPGFSNGVPGAQLASEMLNQAVKYGLNLEQSEVEAIELFSNGRYVRCSNGTGYMTSVVIVAGGSRPKKLGVIGEEKLQGKGVFNCAYCDGPRFAGGVVAVCGGGDSGITEALYLSRIASKVIILEAMPALSASAVLQERASANPKLEIRCGTKVDSILGDNQVEEIGLINSEGRKEFLKVNGILVQIGRDPNTEYIKETVKLDSGRRIIVNQNMETPTPYIFAVGDLRSGSPNQVITAAGDGAIAAISVEKVLQRLE
jgi:thioredoxin reductase (NADPH)